MQPLVFSIPMRTRFRGVTRRDGMVFEGPSGWGEFSPFPEYDDAEAAVWFRAAVDAATGSWPAPVRDTVPVNCTVPAVDPEAAAAIVRASGCSTAKVKVAEAGQTLADDRARVEAVREAIGPDGHVRVDANGGWGVAEAVLAVAVLHEAVRLEYVEQPCARVEDLAAVRRETDVPVAADESIRRADDPFRVADLEAADIAVLKVHPLGGVRRCLEVAEQIGLPVVVSSALDTSVGLAAGLALAAALPELPHACGLATTSLLDGDVVRDPLVAVDGSISVRRPQVDPEVAARHRADPATEAWWWSRFERVREVVEA
ncbi:putative o-succinylbenzoate synthase [Aeromicrobium marinum DSM 15272]|uniref:o-succinylbenzoate synthase n=1 Tax=Aeromicrobium marinum DSM 15272 TaxID=585531 RepID=E2SF22_9ACTN|nr:o-succinylbenzoate synthase [Aeromicrobium marinum]EFQ82266.1 putative o-succinylbenzoate synthase [Aeromicrobium marinum DSM 15272]